MMGLHSFTRRLVFAFALITTGAGHTGLQAGEIDLTRAVVVVPDGLSGPESKAVQVLVEEVRRRSRIGWDTMLRWPSGERARRRGRPGPLCSTRSPSQYRQLVPSQPAGKAPRRLPHPDRRWSRRRPGRGGRRQRCARRPLRRRPAAAMRCG